MRLPLDVNNVEAVKWVAVVAMLCEHVNRYVLPNPAPIAYYIGRIAFPLFAIALGVSLAGRDQASMQRAWRRTFMWGCVAQPLSLLVRDPAPFNVLFVMAAGILLVSLIERRRWLRAAIATFVAVSCSPLAEFSVPGVAMVMAAVYFGRHRSLLSCGALVGAIAFLEVENGNQFALLALPVLYLVGRMDIHVPHVRNVMQYVYAGQFPLLWLAKLL